MLEINSLGGLFLKIDGEIITDVGSHKAEAILVYAAYEDRPINRNYLGMLLWPESSQEKAATSLRVALAALRKSFGEFLDINRDTVFIKPEVEFYLDVHKLCDYIESGKIDAALTLFQGDFLAGFHIVDSPLFEAWQLEIQTQINQLLVDALQKSIDIDISTKDISCGFSHVNQLLKIDPFNEKGYQQSLMLHSLNNDPVSAIAQYKDFEQLLQSELGAAPSEETRSILDRIIKGKSFIEIQSGKQKIHLPSRQTNFIGRKIELFQIGKLLRASAPRLLTLIGPGGVGKSRLAIECGKLTINEFPDGVYFIPFDGCSDKDLLIPLIANTLEFNIDTIATPLEPEDQLVDYLKNRKILLIFDGFDRVISCANILVRILEKSPGLKLLVTSREKLGLEGEWIYPLSGLPIPEIENELSVVLSDSIQLFLSRMVQCAPSYHCSNKEFYQIAEICKKVEGRPLAIELAAAWSGVLSIEEIKKEISKNLDFLEVKTQDLSKEHQSLRALFKSSWDLLSPELQKIIAQLSIFVDTFDRRAAQIIAGVNLNQLSELINKSLIFTIDHNRYSLHSLNRQFAFEKLGTLGDLRFQVEYRYVQYFLDYLISREHALMESNMLQVRSELRQEMAHIFSAIHWICEHGEIAEILKSLEALLVFYAVHGWFEGVNFFAKLVEDRKVFLEDAGNNPGDDPIVFACQVHQAFLLSNLGQIEESEDLSRSCWKPLQKLGLSSLLSECIHNLGVNASFRGEYEEAQAFLEDAIIMGRESEHILWPTYLLWLGHVYFLLGEYEQGMLTLKKCHSIFMEKGTFWGSAFALSKMGLASDGLGDHQQAIHYHQRALEVFEKVENQAGRGYCLSRMSISACHLGDYEQSKIYAERAQYIFKAIGHHWGLSSALSCLGFAQYGLDHSTEACEAFIKALEVSNRDQMAPLSLYALAGLTWILFDKDHRNLALSLLAFVKHHPKMAKAYFDHALCVYKGRDLELVDLEEISIDMKTQQPTLEEMIEKIIPVVCN